MSRWLKVLSFPIGSYENQFREGKSGHLWTACKDESNCGELILLKTAYLGLTLTNLALNALYRRFQPFHYD